MPEPAGRERSWRGRRRAKCSAPKAAFEVQPSHLISVTQERGDCERVTASAARPPPPLRVSVCVCLCRHCAEVQVWGWKQIAQHNFFASRRHRCDSGILVLQFINTFIGKTGTKTLMSWEKQQQKKKENICTRLSMAVVSGDEED